MKEEKSAPVSESELFRRRHAIHIICPVFPIHIGAKCPVFLFKFGAFPCFIKFLVDEGKYRYIISGSNLGVELRKLIQAFYYYLIVGGMPEAVNVYNATHSLNKIQEEQQSIVRQYKLDFTAYEREERKLKINAIYDNIPASPLAMAKETNVFKLFLSDVGLLTSCYPQFIKQELLEMNPDREINNGALFENFVTEQCRKERQHKIPSDIYASGNMQGRQCETGA